MENSSEELDDAATAIQDELYRRRTHLRQYSRWSMHDHLVTTYNILASWKQPVSVRLAGLFGDFGGNGGGWGGSNGGAGRSKKTVTLRTIA
jgi:hypothetical protein